MKPTYEELTESLRACLHWLEWHHGNSVISGGASPLFKDMKEADRMLAEIDKANGKEPDPSLIG